MGLRDIAPVREQVEVPGGAFEVGGLSLEDLARLMKDHVEELKLLVEGNVDFVALLKDSPDFVAAVIACAAGEPDATDNAKALPAGAQLIAVQKIWDLTAVDSAQLGKMLRGLLSGLGSLNSSLESRSVKKPTLPSTPGSKVSSRPRSH